MARTVIMSKRRYIKTLALYSTQRLVANIPKEEGANCDDDPCPKDGNDACRVEPHGQDIRHLKIKDDTTIPRISIIFTKTNGGRPSGTLRR